MFRANERAFQAYATTLLEMSPDEADNFLRKADPEDNASEKLDLIILTDVICSRGMSAFSFPQRMLT